MRPKTEDTLHTIQSITLTTRDGSAFWAGIRDPDGGKKVPSRNTSRGNGTSLLCRRQTSTSSTNTWRVTFMWLIVVAVLSCSIRTLFTRTSRLPPFTSMIPEMGSSRSWEWDNQDGSYRLSSPVHHSEGYRATANHSSLRYRYTSTTNSSRNVV